MISGNRHGRRRRVARASGTPKTKREVVKRGIDHPLVAILALAITALLANRLSVLAISQWGKH